MTWTDAIIAINTMRTMTGDNAPTPEAIDAAMNAMGAMMRGPTQINRILPSGGWVHIDHWMMRDGKRAGQRISISPIGQVMAFPCPEATIDETNIRTVPPSVQKWIAECEARIPKWPLPADNSDAGTL